MRAWVCVCGAELCWKRRAQVLTDHTCAWTRAHTHTHTHMHARTHARTRAHARTHTHTHTHTQQVHWASSPSSCRSFWMVLMCVRVCVCTCACVCLYVWIEPFGATHQHRCSHSTHPHPPTHTHTHTHTHTGIFHGKFPRVFGPNTIAMLQRDGMSFTGVAWRKRRDRALQVHMCVGACACA